MLYQHDAEDPDNLAYLGTTPHGEEVEINKRAAESDLLVYVNINLVAMDGGWKSTATGLASYRSLRHHHNPTTMEASHSFMDQHRSELHKSNWRMGKVLVDSGVKVFQIETTLNTDTFPTPFEFLSKREWEWTAKDRATYLGTAKSLALAPTRLARKIFHSIEAPHQMTSVQAGEVEAVHQVDDRERLRASSSSRSQGQTDILTMGIPYICPYNVNSIMNPILVMCMGLGYLFNMYRGKPLVREGGVVIMTHPTQPDFHPVHHPSYIDFFEQVLADTTDPHVMSKKYEKQYAKDEWYRHLYRTSYAYHGVHPFYMWYWGAHGDAALRAGDHRRRRPEGRAPARLRAGVDAGRRVRDRVRRRRPLADDHPHPHPADPDGGRHVSASDDVAPTTASRAAARPRRAAGQVERAVGRHRPRPAATSASRTARRPCPRGVEVPEEPPTLGADYDTDWARSPAARVARGVIAEGPMRADRARPRRSRGLRHRPPRRPAPPGRRVRRAAAAADLRPQPPQPPRHRADGPRRAVHVAQAARRRRGRRLLLRQALEGDAVGAVAERHPDRPRVDRAASRPT